MRMLFVLATAVLTVVMSAALGSHTAVAQDMNFFITSAGPGDGAKLGGLSGADQHCQILADNVGAGGLSWRAYLSAAAAGGQIAVNARDRIGAGPWYNAKAVMVARDVDDLHGPNNKLSKENSLTEAGAVVNGRGDSPNMHDILTGSQLDGTAIEQGQDTTCENWSSNGGGSARVGHHDRTGGGENPESWNSAHGSRGCSQTDLQGTGGNGLFYCFSIN